jgi:serine/threonine-protein kinase
VAIKVLPAAWAADAERLRRFEQEARAAAALNHPNILAVHDIGQEPAPDGGAPCHYIVSELLEGQTLRERLASAEPAASQMSLGVRKTIEYGIQIALGLAAAHEKGIVHRDLKPENIFLTSDGRVKILDFGLAKLTEAELAVGAPSVLPTEAAAARPPQTVPGVVMGTAGYMAPEQVRGLPVDYRADIFALGAILYEMIAGRRAFRGDTQMDTMLAILKEEPPGIPAAAASAAVPPALTRIIERCLEKSPAARFQSTRDLAFALEAVSTSTVTTPAIAADTRPATAPSRGGAPTWLYVSAAAVAASMLTGITVWTIRPAISPPAVQRFVIPLPEGDAFAGMGRRFVAVSPDGARVAYLANNQIYLRAIDQLDAQPITGTTLARSPFFSPDGQWIGFWQAGQLKKISVSGGAPLVLCDAVNPFGASWERDGTILFGQGPEGIAQVPDGGGTLTVVVTVDKGKNEVAYGPELLSDGKTILFTVATPVEGVAAGAAWDRAQIVVQARGSADRRVVVQGGSEAHVVSSGHLVYEREGTLVAVPFDSASGVVNGTPVPVIESVMAASRTIPGGVTAGGLTGGTGAAQFAVSANGLLVYVEGTGVTSDRRMLVWVDRQGHETPVPGLAERAYVYPVISPDGERVALDIRDQNQDIWLFDFARQTLTKLTFDPAPDIGPLWTPNGERVAYFRAGAGLFWQPANGTGAPEQLTIAGVGVHGAESFTRDGTRLVFSEQTSASKGQYALKAMTIGGETADLPLDQNSTNAAISPDGRWLAYQAGVGGPPNVYVRPFPDINGGKWQVSRTAATRPVWSRNGRELFFFSQAGPRTPVTVMSVAVDPTSTSTFKFGNATALFTGPYFEALNSVTYDVSPDGQRFLMIKDAASTSDAPVARLVVVDNWLEELKRRVPVN